MNKVSIKSNEKDSSTEKDSIGKPQHLSPTFKNPQKIHPKFFRF